MQSAFICCIFVAFVFAVIVESCEHCLCGISPNIDFYDGFNQNRILGGKISDPNNWPFVVKMNNGTCTASIIGEQWILSAAHCQPDGGIVTIEAGGKIYESEPIFVHEHYISSDYVVENDIMLIKLKEPIEFSETVSPVCLMQNITVPPGHVVAVTGFGVRFKGVKELETTFQEGDLLLDDINFEKTESLQETPVIIRDMEFCEAPEEYSKTRICAGGTLRGTTQGDSGGPMLIVNEHRWVQCGVTSYGSNQAVPGDVTKVKDLGIYTRVGAYCDWIAEKTSQKVKCQ
uniref:Peptidase S1 domain-containing protein n=1 Tax=Panagrolaimus sp. PS1159 TaxID=55785 RepID=A0AC35GMB9_9BILA